MEVRWYGQAAFRLVSATDGRTVFLDPFRMPGPEWATRGFRFDYPPIVNVAAHLVLITHEHFDHNAADVVAGDPQVIWSAAGTFDTPVGQVTGVVADHDPAAGTQRGMNVIYVFSLDGLRVCHFGDYGQASLRPEQETAIGRVDLLMLPVGGGPTVGAEAAGEVVRRLSPRCVVPMHYRTPAVSFLEPADAFLAQFSRVERLAAPEFDPAALPVPSARDQPVVVVPSVPGWP